MNDRDAAALPAIVQVTAHTHIAMLNTLLPDWLAGWYAVGSAALGCFDGRFSDLDFLAFVHRNPDAGELARLRIIHRDMGNRRLFAPLDGCYVPLDALGNRGIHGLQFNDGRFLGLAPFQMDSPDVWILKQFGVCFFGLEPGRLPVATDWARVKAGILENLNTYWRGWVGGCRRPADRRSTGLCLSPAALEWGVLGISRLYYSLREDSVTGKVGAGEYALRTVPARFHPIIREALRRRDGDIPTQYSSPLKRRRDALDYMEYIIRECNRAIPPRI